MQLQASLCACFSQVVEPIRRHSHRGTGALVGAAIGAAVGGGAGNLIGKHMDKVKAEAERVKNAQVETVTDANGLSAVKVTFASGILFPTNGSTLSSSAKTARFLSRVILMLQVMTVSTCH